MKANELMIGDWVCCTDPTPFKIEAITIIVFPEYVIGDDGFDVDISDLQPIPLTAEILERNGFEKKNDGIQDFYIYGNVILTEDYDTAEKEYYWALCIGNRQTDVSLISIHYVHELQHVLKLCKIEKEVVL